MRLFKKKTCCPEPAFGIWDKPEELHAKDSFSARTVILQRRECETCGFVESRTVASVHSRN